MQFVRRRRNRSNSGQPRAPEASRTDAKPTADCLVPKPPSAPKTGLDIDALTTDPHDMCCPVTLDLYKDPVIASDGFTYERQAIETIIARQGCSPNTREVLSGQLNPNKTKKAEVDEYRVQRASACLDLAVQQTTTGNYIMANQLLERAVSLNGGTVTIYIRWISLLESMSWHAKALVIRFFLAEEYLKQDKVDAAIKVYEDLMDGFQSNQPTKLPALLFNGGIQKFDLDTPGNVACIMVRPIMLHINVAEKLLPLLMERGERSQYKKLLLKVSEGGLKYPDMLPQGAAKLEGLQMAGIKFLGPDDLLWNLLAQVQLLQEKVQQAGSSYVNAARCCGMAGDNEAAEWYLTKSTEVGCVEGMMALIDFMRDKEDTYKQIIARQHKDLVAVRRANEERSQSSRSGSSSSMPPIKPRQSKRPGSSRGGSDVKEERLMAKLANIEDGEWLARLCLETEEDQNCWRLADLWAKVQADPSIKSDCCAFRGSWIDRTQTSAEAVFIILKKDMEDAETVARSRLGATEDAGWEEVMFGEEAHWTKVNVCIIEKAYRSYRARHQVNQLIRRRKILSGRGASGRRSRKYSQIG
mmetsp:Transcript_154255/g.269852  ORF Transcript_154255/g.269852 Transcript_154255/m.269852 type:complete len:583 (-) Transcript_154255:252-2000(-)